jgi:uncharacterized protein YkwD
MIYLLLLSVFAGFYSEPLKLEPKVSISTEFSSFSLTIGKEEKEIHNLINKYRERNGLGELEWDEDLALLASLYAEKMASENFFSHYDLNGDSVVKRAQKMRITKWRSIGENLFTCRGYTKFTKLAFDSWLDSESHRRNILEENFTHTGIGIAKTGDGRVYITQVFIQR